MLSSRNPLQDAGMKLDNCFLQSMLVRLATKNGYTSSQMKDYKRNPFAFSLRLLVTIAFVVCISGCSVLKWFGKNKEEEVEIDKGETAEKFYKEAHGSLMIGDITDAVEKFELLEARYPFGRYAQQAQLELAYAYYKQGKSELALNSINQFIKLNPLHPNIDYAYYLKGLIIFDSGKSPIHWLISRDPSNNDPTSLRGAFDIFSLLIGKYPESKYADDAKLRMIYLRNELAEYELKVAKFYMKRGAYVASANRAKYIMENYQGAEVMPEALYVLEQAYVQLDLSDLAEDTHRIYIQNFQAGKEGAIQEDFARKTRSCAQGFWRRLLEKLRFRTYYCN